MKVLFAVSEALPFVSSGGLADVSGSLPSAVKKLSGCDIRVVLPYYECIKNAYGTKMNYICSYTVTLAWRKLYCGVFSYIQNDVTYYFLDNEYYFKRQSVYGDFDDCERFAFFSKAVLDLMSEINFFPDVLHANDWQSALCIPYLKKIYINDPRYKSIYSIFTIHNIMYQGRFGSEVFKDITGLPEFCKNDMTNDGDINFMKGAIETADKVTTVSPTYRDELLRGENSFGMEHSLRRRENDFLGIVNGIDTDYYSLKSDKLHYCYNGNIFTFKKENKLHFQREAGLEESEEIPLICMVSRLCEQKGMSIIKPVVEELLNGKIQLAVLGKGEYMEEEFFKYLERIHPDKVRAYITFDKDLSFKIYSASDILLMPSKAEPCGISQMIAARYGTIPVVRECGGLRDTVRCYDNTRECTSFGFTFWEYSASALKGALLRATEACKDKATHERLTMNATSTDFSWYKSAKKYIEVYKHQ